MVKPTSLFSQILYEIPKTIFTQLIHKHQCEKSAKGFRSWTHFVAMLFCQLAHAKSLREICGGLKCCLGKLRHLGIPSTPKRSTLSYANQHRPWWFFRDLFYTLYGHISTFAPKKRFRFKNKLLSLDATVIDLCLSLFPWAKFRRTKGAVKLHMLLDHDGYMPTYALITEGKVHEVNVAWELQLPEESIVVMDRGYNDYELFAKWTAEKVWFVTRMKENAVYDVVRWRNVTLKGNVLSDQDIVLTGTNASDKCSYILRRVVVWDEKNLRTIELLTNHTKFSSNTIASIYKDRWQIELFWKALKQNLKIKTFVGTSENALHIQIWTALIAMLIIKFLQFRSKINWSLSNLVALLRWNLFTYRDLWKWINNPFETPPLEPIPIQMHIPI